MDSVNILDYSLLCAQGDASETLDAIKSSNIRVSSEVVPTLEEKIEIPYFLLQKQLQEKQENILSAMKDVISPIVAKLDNSQRARTAILVGTALIDKYVVDSVEDSVYDYKRKPYDSAKRSIDTYAKELSHEFGLNDFTMTINTACTSSINAVLEARNLIHSDVVDYAIVIGVEVYSQMMSSGFSSMKLLSQESQKPFDVSRDGLVLGEAVAAVLVGKDDSNWSFRGGYSNSNSINITSVSADGTEYVEVMQKAMEFSNIKPEEITALKAHATSTPTNDMSEINAISKIFDKNLTFTALKPYTGHTLGACGVLELAILMEAINDGFIPKTINHKNSIIEGYTPLQEHKECSSGIFMLNYFGFGGNNTSVIVQKS